LPAGAVYVFAVMMTSICKTYYQFILAQGVLGGIAMGLTMAPGMAAAGQYFNKNRGAAMGLAVAGSSIGGVIFPIAISRMLANQKLGFGWSMRICGFIILGALLAASSVIRARLPPRKGRFFLPTAFKEPAYIALIAAVFFIMLGLFTPFFYLPTYAVEHGMSTQLASYLVSILNGASFFGRVIQGILADKVGRLNMLLAAGLASGILIFCLQKMDTNATIILFSALYGFTSGAIVSLASVNLAQVPKNPGDIGTYMGQGMAVVAIGTLIGPPTNGALLSRYHSFDRPLIMSGVFVVAGGLLVIVAKLAAKKGVFTKS
jgi:MFS family permease